MAFFSHMGGSEIKYIKNAFDTNWIAPLGPNVDAFEDSLTKFCKVRHAAVLSSGTAAIHLALVLLGVKPGDEVIASTFTFFSNNKSDYLSGCCSCSYR
jgi:dTDP-4-amino-4,6-dideoxygalactose transaminase